MRTILLLIVSTNPKNCLFTSLTIALANKNPQSNFAITYHITSRYLISYTFLQLLLFPILCISTVKFASTLKTYNSHFIVTIKLLLRIYNQAQRTLAQNGREANFCERNCAYHNKLFVKCVTYKLHARQKTDHEPCEWVSRILFE